MADIVRKTASLNDPLHVGFVRTYLVDGKEVYRETLDKNLDIIKKEGSLPDGTVKEFFDNGKVYFECEFKNGVRNGLCRIYFDNGKVSIEKLSWGSLPLVGAMLLALLVVAYVPELSLCLL